MLCCNSHSLNTFLSLTSHPFYFHLSPAMPPQSQDFPFMSSAFSNIFLMSSCSQLQITDSLSPRSLSTHATAISSHSQLHLPLNMFQPNEHEQGPQASTFLTSHFFYFTEVRQRQSIVPEVMTLCFGIKSASYRAYHSKSISAQGDFPCYFPGGTRSLSFQPLTWQP